MTSITLAELAERPGAVELAQVTQQPGEAAISPVALALLMRGEDIAAVPEVDITAARAAIRRIEDVMEEAQGVIDGYLRQGGYALPLPRIPLILKGWARAIVRYRLHAYRISDEKSDPIVRDYRDALKLLELTATGKFSLGIGDTRPVAGGRPAVTGPGRTFSMDSLQDYGK